MMPTFSAYGTAQSYAKSKQLIAKWNLKKSGQDIQTKSTSISSATFSRKQATADKVTQIMTKLKSGKRPSAEDLQFLKDNSPAYYQKVVKILQERDQYKADLEKCKTKDDVKRLELQKTQQITMEADAVMNNPNIPDSKKLEFAEEVMIRNAGLSAEKASFTSSGKYAKLKWEHEIAAAEKEAEQAEPEQAEPEQVEPEQVEPEQVEPEHVGSDAPVAPSDDQPILPTDQNNQSKKNTQNGTKKTDNDLPFERAKRKKKQYKVKFRPIASTPPFPQKAGANFEISASPSPVSAPPLQTAQPAQTAPPAQTAKKAIYASTVANTATPAKAIVKFSAVI